MQSPRAWLAVGLLAIGCGGAEPSEAPTTVAAASDSCFEVAPGEDERWRDLRADLGTWAFADGRHIPASDEITPEEAERLLDDAAAHVTGLEGPAAWSAAARYFQAENFHGLEGPACRRASR
jgi:hypothetical protein